METNALSTLTNSPVVGACAHMHSWVVTFIAYLEFSFLHEMSRIFLSRTYYGAISWDMKAPSTEICSKHYRDKT